MAETPCGSVHESPVRHLPHANVDPGRMAATSNWAPHLPHFMSFMDASEHAGGNLSPCRTLNGAS